MSYRHLVLLFDQFPISLKHSFELCVGGAFGASFGEVRDSFGVWVLLVLNETRLNILFLGSHHHFVWSFWLLERVFINIILNVYFPASQSAFGYFLLSFREVVQRLQDPLLLLEPGRYLIRN